MVSVRIDAETPEEVVVLLRGLAARVSKGDVTEEIGDSEGEFVKLFKFISDALVSRDASSCC